MQSLMCLLGKEYDTVADIMCPEPLGAVVHVHDSRSRGLVDSLIADNLSRSITHFLKIAS